MGRVSWLTFRLCARPLLRCFCSFMRDPFIQILSNADYYGIRIVVHMNSL
jgi:hypothetical protein